VSDAVRIAVVGDVVGSERRISVGVSSGLVKAARNWSVRRERRRVMEKGG